MTFSYSTPTAKKAVRDQASERQRGMRSVKNVSEREAKHVHDITEHFVSKFMLIFKKAAVTHSLLVDHVTQTHYTANITVGITFYHFPCSNLPL